MGIRLVRWTAELKTLESDISTAVSSLDEPRRDAFYSRLSRDSEKVLHDRLKNFDKLQRAHEEEMNAEGAEKDCFLLKLEDKRSRCRSQWWLLDMEKALRP